MRLKTLLAVAVAGAFAVPFAAQVLAAGDNMILAQGGPAGASSTGTGPSGGTTTAPAPVSPSGSGTTGTTAGPDAASNKTAPSSDTATSPSTSGQGKPE